MNNITVSKMKKENIKDILEIQKGQNANILSEDDLLSSLNLETAYYIVASINDKIIGYAGISYVMDSADLIAIVVSKEYTNKGIASLLLENIFSFCKKNNIISIFLEVRKSNNIAIHLYEKNGFKQISIRKNYYNNLEDAIIFKKEL